MSKAHPAMVVAGSLRTEEHVRVYEHTFITLSCPKCLHQAEYDLDPMQKYRGTLRCHSCKVILEFSLAAAAGARSNVVPLRRAR